MTNPPVSVTRNGWIFLYNKTFHVEIESLGTVDCGSFIEAVNTAENYYNEVNPSARIVISQTGKIFGRVGIIDCPNRDVFFKMKQNFPSGLIF